MEERTLVIRRLSTGSIFRLVAAGAFLSIVPLCVFFGVLALFGMNKIRWNNEPIYGIRGLLLSPLFGILMAAIFTGIGGAALALGSWLYSKFRPLKLRVYEDGSVASGPNYT
ncbi:MAG TPA: hypothetical protein VGI65_04480 [Steroidobacteraceae bacterium]|jgi:hypothetical protein